MTRSAAPIAALLAALTLAACGTTAVSIRPAARSFTPDDYDDIYGRWTRAEDEFAFGRLEDILHVTATFESWEFRWAYVIRYAADYALQTEAWRVLLVDASGRQVRPIEVTHLRRPGAAERVYFPSISVHRQTFRIAFPTQHPDGTPVISPDDSHVVLRFTGAEGRVDLRWDIDASAPAAPPLVIE